MRKGAVKIPNEALDRTIEYAGSDPRTRLLKFGSHIALKLINLWSRLEKSYHFDSIGEFLRLQLLLQPDIDRVAFSRDVTVVGKDCMGSTLELRISDGTGQARLMYQCIPQIEDGVSIHPHVMYDPMHGSTIGDRIQVFYSWYINEGTLLIKRAWQIKNDDHYRRIRETTRNKN